MDFRPPINISNDDTKYNNISLDHNDINFLGIDNYIKNKNKDFMYFSQNIIGFATVDDNILERLYNGENSNDQFIYLDNIEYEDIYNGYPTVLCYLDQKYNIKNIIDQHNDIDLMFNMDDFVDINERFEFHYKVNYCYKPIYTDIIDNNNISYMIITSDDDVFYIDEDNKCYSIVENNEDIIIDGVKFEYMGKSLKKMKNIKYDIFKIIK